MQYKIVFDVVDEGYRYWPFPAVFIGFIMLILCELFFRRKLPGWRLSGVRKLMLYLGLGFCSLWSLQTFNSTYSDYVELRDALQKGRTVVIEGKVENFIPMPKAGHSNESFTVAGYRFEYSEYETTAGFNRTKSHGGPIALVCM